MSTPGRNTPFRVNELSGDKFAARQFAQGAARDQLAADLAAIIRDLVAAGELTIIAGKVDAGSPQEAEEQ